MSRQGGFEDGLADSTYEPGLGCPHCPDGFYTFKERADHIKSEHPGNYTGPSQDMLYAAERAGVSSKTT